jgi:hypothetical protein
MSPELFPNLERMTRRPTENFCFADLLPCFLNDWAFDGLENGVGGILARRNQKLAFAVRNGEVHKGCRRYRVITQVHKPGFAQEMVLIFYNMPTMMWFLYSLCLFALLLINMISVKCSPLSLGMWTFWLWASVSLTHALAKINLTVP